MCNDSITHVASHHIRVFHNVPTSRKPNQTRPKTFLSQLKQNHEDLGDLTNEEEAFNSFTWYRQLTRQLDGDKAFGKLTFAGITQHIARYALIKPTFDMETIYEELMIKRWRLERPNLLISVTGVADDINGIDGGLMDDFRRGLYESASRSNAWIISGGLNAGVMREVGQARRQYGSASGDDVPIIGLPMWNEIMETKELALAADDEQPRHTHIAANMYRQLNPHGFEKKALDPNHKYFLLIDDQDDGGESLEGWKGYQFRHDFQNYITTRGGDPR